MSQGQKLHSQNMLRPPSFEHVSHEEACSLVEPAQSDNLVSPVSNHLSPHSPSLRPSPSLHSPTHSSHFFILQMPIKTEKAAALALAPMDRIKTPRGGPKPQHFFRSHWMILKCNQNGEIFLHSGDKKWSREERIREEVEPVRKCQKFPSKEFLSSYTFSDQPLFLDSDTGERESERERERKALP